jgi:hypothetical protein
LTAYLGAIDQGTTEVQGIHIDVTYAGTIESKDAMKGTVHLGDVGNGTFTAKRQ